MAKIKVVDARITHWPSDESRGVKSYKAYAFKAMHGSVQFILCADSQGDAQVIFAQCFGGRVMDYKRAGVVRITPVRHPAGRKRKGAGK